MLPLTDRTYASRFLHRSVTYEAVPTTELAAAHSHALQHRIRTTHVFVGVAATLVLTAMLMATSVHAAAATSGLGQGEMEVEVCFDAHGNVERVTRLGSGLAPPVHYSESCSDVAMARTQGRRLTTANDATAPRCKRMRCSAPGGHAVDAPGSVAAHAAHHASGVDSTAADSVAASSIATDNVAVTVKQVDEGVGASSPVPAIADPLAAVEFRTATLRNDLIVHRITVQHGGYTHGGKFEPSRHEMGTVLGVETKAKNPVAVGWAAQALAIAAHKQSAWAGAVVLPFCGHDEVRAPADSLPSLLAAGVAKGVGGRVDRAVLTHKTTPESVKKTPKAHRAAAVKDTYSIAEDVQLPPEATWIVVDNSVSTGASATELLRAVHVALHQRGRHDVTVHLVALGIASSTDGGQWSHESARQALGDAAVDDLITTLNAIETERGQMQLGKGEARGMVYKFLNYVGSTAQRSYTHETTTAEMIDTRVLKGHLKLIDSQATHYNSKIQNAVVEWRTHASQGVGTFPPVAAVEVLASEPGETRLTFERRVFAAEQRHIDAVFANEEEQPPLNLQRLAGISPGLTWTMLRQLVEAARAADPSGFEQRVALAIEEHARAMRHGDWSGWKSSFSTEERAAAGWRVNPVAERIGTAIQSWMWHTADPVEAERRLLLVAPVAVSTVAVTWALAEPAEAERRLTLAAQVARVSTAAVTWALAEPGDELRRLYAASWLARVSRVAVDWALETAGDEERRFVIAQRCCESVPQEAVSWAFADRDAGRLHARSTLVHLFHGAGKENTAAIINAGNAMIAAFIRERCTRSAFNVFMMRQVNVFKPMRDVPNQATLDTLMNEAGFT